MRVHNLCVLVSSGRGESEEWRTDRVRHESFCGEFTSGSITESELRAVHSLLFGLAVRISEGNLADRWGVVTKSSRVYSSVVKYERRTKAARSARSPGREAGVE